MVNVLNVIVKWLLACDYCSNCLLRREDQIEHRERTYSVGRIARLYSGSVKEEPDGSGGLPLTFAKRVHQLLQLRGALDLEENLIVVVCNFDIEMLAGTFRWALVLLWWWGRIRHV